MIVTSYDHEDLFYFFTFPPVKWRQLQRVKVDVLQKSESLNCLLLNTDRQRECQGACKAHCSRFTHSVSGTQFPESYNWEARLDEACTFPHDDGSSIQGLQIPLKSLP